MPAQFHIRRAAIADADVIARHRARMFYDMGDIPNELFEEFQERSRAHLCEMFERGEYVGWLASPPDSLGEIVGGAGVQLRRVSPHPSTGPNGERGIAEGRHAIVINVFTEPEWRRRGAAALLMQQIIDWARTEKIDRLVLHASDDGRALYERLGFVPTNEMKFPNLSFIANAAPPPD
jgi:GNAT superfamily N-acetyltransferase